VDAGYCNVAGVVHDFVRVVDCELCRVCFEGRKAVVEFNSAVVKGCTGEVAYP
jgi:hypothetical protein